ncbi:hypothetical protein M422DRAFT_33602 [Sphaerobolus stellatus SS14]|uniref:Uncharacterized protein n=1 Tax=Sphaerobolus stellatus (strain SS14) TaxID=990650 RepID=A0A0C9VJA0_SPHS4|nr:hypothetical protein M422DRAFT_33602 [Sphaerobolus stellatus SS14]
MLVRGASATPEGTPAASTPSVGRKRKHVAIEDDGEQPTTSAGINDLTNAVQLTRDVSRPRLDVSRHPIFVPAPDGSPYYVIEVSAVNRQLDKVGFKYMPAGVAEPGNVIPYRTIESRPQSTRVSWEDRSPSIKVTQDGLRLMVDKGFCSARANVGVQEGNWYMEIYINPGPDFDHSPPPDVEALLEGRPNISQERTWRPMSERYPEFMEQQWQLDAKEEAAARGVPHARPEGQAKSEGPAKIDGQAKTDGLAKREGTEGKEKIDVDEEKARQKREAKRLREKARRQRKKEEAQAAAAAAAHSAQPAGEIGEIHLTAVNTFSDHPPMAANVSSYLLQRAGATATAMDVDRTQGDRTSSQATTLVVKEEYRDYSYSDTYQPQATDARQGSSGAQSPRSSDYGGQADWQSEGQSDYGGNEDQHAQDNDIDHMIEDVLPDDAPAVQSIRFEESSTRWRDNY